MWLCFLFKFKVYFISREDSNPHSDHSYGAMIISVLMERLKKALADQNTASGYQQCPGMEKNIVTNAIKHSKKETQFDLKQIRLTET